MVSRTLYSAVCSSVADMQRDSHSGSLDTKLRYLRPPSRDATSRDTSTSAAVSSPALCRLVDGAVTFGHYGRTAIQADVRPEDAGLGGVRILTRSENSHSVLNFYGLPTWSASLVQVQQSATHWPPESGNSVYEA